MKLSEEVSQEVADAVLASIQDYADSLVGKSTREVMSSKYEPPEVVKGLGYANANVKAAVDMWDDAQQQWRSRYGSLDGWNSFHDYWSLSGFGEIPDWAHGASAEDVFASAKFQSLRDRFGYADKQTLYNYGLADIGRGRAW